MYVSLKWLERIIQIPNLSLNFFTERLILAGFEVDNIEKKTYDIILDINITANRADGSNVKGFTNELLSLFSRDLNFQKLSQLKPLAILYENGKNHNFIGSLQCADQQEKFSLQRENSINVRDSLNSILFKYYLWEHYKQKNYLNINKKKLIIHVNKSNYIPIFHEISNDILVTESPQWIKKRLLVMNFTPINNIIDTINYILLETGQVFFAYDVDALQKFAGTSTMNFISQFINEPINLSVSSSETIILNESLLALTLNKKIISLLGLIQDYNTIINTKTIRFLLQTNIYDSRQIKKLSKITGLKTEYSTKLEKQIDLNLLEQAYFRLKYLFKIQGIYFKKGELPESPCLEKEKSSFYWHYVKHSHFKIKILLKNIHDIIGPPSKLTQLPTPQIFTSLKALNFKILHNNRNYFIIQVPLERQNDIEQEVDIIEEIIRVIGFQHFPSILPYPNKNKSGALTKLEKLKRRLRTYFLNFGFNESILSILSQKALHFEPLLKNPLFNESSVLKISLLKSLLEKVKFNQSIAQEGFETFEIGRVYKFITSSNGIKEELELLSGIFGGKVFRSKWQNKDSILNWFEAKGLLENLLAKLSLSTQWKQANYDFTTIFHPARTANIFIDTTLVGTFGQINPLLALKENFNNQIYLFEFNLENLNRSWKHKTSITYSQYSLYPISFIDLSCITKKSLSFQVIKDEILSVGQPLLKSIELFDYYSEPPIKNGYCSLSFKLQFTSETRTLLNTEVTAIITKITHSLENNFGIEFN